MTFTVFTPAQAAEHVATSRAVVDAACESGALVAQDIRGPLATKHRWRIVDDDLLDWVRRGYPRA